MQHAQQHEVHLHPFLRPDHWDVADIWIASWDSSLPTMSHFARHDWVFHRLEALHSDGAFTICALNKRTGAIAGFATADPARGELTRIAVASSARGAGVSVALLQRVKALAPRGLVARVPGANARALRFFAREGFEAVEPAAIAGKGEVVMRWGGEG